MQHINNWNSTGRMHQTETHWVPPPEDLPPVPSVPVSKNSRNKRASTRHDEEVQAEPMHVDEEVNVRPEEDAAAVPAIPEAPVVDPKLRMALVQRFREEVIQDMMQDFLKENEASQYRICAHEHHHTQLEIAVLNDGRADDKPYLVVEHIVRHDWHPVTGNCIYTVGIGGGPSRGSAETLAYHYSGVPYAVWEYWGKRTRTRQKLVTHYVDNFGTNDFYRVLMWHWLSDDRWLSLWRARRASRRG